MTFDPQIVAQANQFVNALRSGKPAHVPVLKLEHWQQFMTTVYAGYGDGSGNGNTPSVYPALGLA